jgi:hypothetical protein
VFILFFVYRSKIFLKIEDRRLQNKFMEKEGGAKDLMKLKQAATLTLITINKDASGVTTPCASIFVTNPTFSPIPLWRNSKNIEGCCLQSNFKLKFEIDEGIIGVC